MYIYTYQESSAMYRFIMSEPWYMEMILHNMCLKAGRTSVPLWVCAQHLSPRLHLWFPLNAGICTEDLRWSFWPHIFWCVFFPWKKKTTTQHLRHKVFSHLFAVLIGYPTPPPCLLLGHSRTQLLWGELVEGSTSKGGSREHTSWDPYMFEGTLSLK